MAADIQYVKPVYLNAKLTHLRHSAHHRALAAAPVEPNHQPGTDQQLIALEFWGGVVREGPGGPPAAVPLRTYELFRDLGIATTDRPRTQWELDEGA